MSTKLIVTHTVSDYASWKKGFDSHGGARDAAGFTLVFLGQSVDDPNSVTICFDVPSAEAARAFLANPDLQKAMKDGGVTSAPESHIVSVA